MKVVIKKITDIITIIFPAFVAVMGIFGLQGAVEEVQKIEQTALIILGAVSTIASLVYNSVTKDPADPVAVEQKEEEVAKE